MAVAALVLQQPLQFRSGGEQCLLPPSGQGSEDAAAGQQPLLLQSRQLLAVTVELLLFGEEDGRWPIQRLPAPAGGREGEVATVAAGG